MNLLSKIAVIVLLSFLGLLCVSLGYYYWRVMGDFLSIEESLVNKNASRLSELLDSERQQMEVTARDWAQWDDMYNYMGTPTRKFEESWSVYDSYKALRIVETLFFDTKRKLVFGVHVNLVDEEVVKTSKDSPLIQDILKSDRLFNLDEHTTVQAFYATISDKVALVATSQILDSAVSRPSRGTMMIIKWVDDEFVEKLKQQMRLPVEPIRNENDAHYEFFGKNTDSSSLIKLVNSNRIHVEVPVRNLDHRPILIFNLTDSRPVYNQGLASMRMFFWFWFACSITAVFLVIFLLRKFVLVRLDSVCGFLNSVSKNRSFGERLVVQGHDELSSLSADINHTLVSLSQAHKEVLEAQSLAVEANRAKSLFIARVSHELRNPIGGILGINRMIKKEEDLPQSIRELIVMSDRTATGLISIVDEILDFAKVEAGQLVLENIPFEPRQIIREAMQTVAGRLEYNAFANEQASVELVCDVRASVPQKLVGDPTRLTQILVNLLSNALKFTERGFVGLRVEALVEENRKGLPRCSLQMTVWDTGVGIPEERLDAIFEPFKQADASVARVYQGTGLGLAIVKQFSEALGGTVTVTSDVNKGASFLVTIPLAACGAESYLSTLQANHSEKIWPEVTLVHGDSPVGAALRTNLQSFGQVNWINSSALAPSELRTRIEQAGELLAISEDALVLPGILDTVRQRLAAGKATVAMVRPSNLELRSELFASGARHVLPTPVLAEDILLAYFNEDTSDEEDWEEDELGLQTERSLNILIADDTPTNLIVLCDLLTDAGHKVETVSNGQELLRRATPMLMGEKDGEHFDIIITDITMPIMDGYEATRAIRKLESEQGNSVHVPIIAITAHALSSEQEQIMQAGVDGIVTKPVFPEALALEFERLLARGGKELM